MRLLVDTHLLLWAIASSRRLPKEARQLFEAPDNELFYSAASLWEIAIKASLGRASFLVDITGLQSTLAEMEFEELPVRGVHAEQVARLPFHHRDPFDRMLVAQSLVEPLVLITNDEALAPYGTSVRLIK